MMRIQTNRCRRDPLARPFGATCAQGTGSVRISREDRQVNTLSASNNLSPPDTYGRVIGGEGESLSPAAKKNDSGLHSRTLFPTCEPHSLRRWAAQR